MRSWTGIALAHAAPGDDGMYSRLSTYLHPLAGRPLAWHTLSALASLRPAAARLLVVGGPELNPLVFGGIGTDPELLAPQDGAVELPEHGAERVLLLDAAAPVLGPALPTLLEESESAVLPGPDGSVAALLLSAGEAEALLQAGGSPGDLARRAEGLRWLRPVPEAVVVRDRASLARAQRLMRDRIVERLMARGVTFLLPDSVLVDVEVQIGRDTIIYPGAVIEGQTAIGEETVVGPGCRIVDSWIGSGVELKGWNFISRSSIRNRAILEPYVRRGFD
jgi:hypothetical protein